jgi:hypothetical protein
MGTVGLSVYVNIGDAVDADTCDDLQSEMIDCT